MKYKNVIFKGELEKNLKLLIEGKIIKSENFTHNSKIPRFLKLLDKANIRWLNYGYTFKDARIKEVSLYDIEYHENKVSKAKKGLWHLGELMEYKNTGEFCHIDIGEKIQIFRFYYYARTRKDCINYRKENKLNSKIKKASDLKYVIFSPLTQK